MKKIALYLIMAAIFSVGCDKIEGPYLQISDRESVDVEFPELNPSGVYRKILMEEYTGHRCSNCPAAHLVLESLHDRYGDTLAIVGIHATSLADPNIDYPYDFRTETGNELANEFTIGTIPAAVINRENHAGGWGRDEWINKLAEVDRSKVYAAIQVINQPKSNGVIKVNTKVTMLKEYPHPVLLSIFIIEDGVIRPQLNGFDLIPDYTHNHVLRTSANGTYGTPLTTSGILDKGESYLYAKSVKTADTDWDLANCTAVVFLHDRVNGEVLQVETAPLLVSDNK